MDDLEIIRLYWSRNENAIHETNLKYGHLLHRIAKNILSNCEDSEECLNDTYNKAWETIPPKNPDSLCAYLGRIIRNIAINRWHNMHTQKRGNNLDILLSELSDCIPSTDSFEQEIEAKELSEVISDWLYSLNREDRVLFLRRYWYGDKLSILARNCGISSNKLAGRMYRLRSSLKKYLEKEGVWI